MSGPVERVRSFAFVPVAFVVWAASTCVSVPPEDRGNSSTPDAARADAGKPTDGAKTPDLASAEAPIAPTTCREIRVCVYDCGEDLDCAARCASSATTAARALYQQGRACSMQACPDQDVECRCDQECHGLGQCTDIFDECDDAASDPFCDHPCH
jgi:hypothetical protein